MTTDLEAPERARRYVRSMTELGSTWGYGPYVAVIRPETYSWTAGWDVVNSQGLVVHKGMTREYAEAFADEANTVYAEMLMRKGTAAERQPRTSWLDLNGVKHD